MASHSFHALILAGGRGTRFWPRSRTLTPKQLLSFVGDQSLLRQTVDRLRPLVAPERVWILTNDFLCDAIAQELPEIPREHILAEPVQRNTAPCLALAAKVIGETDPDAVLGVFPADHYITKPERFREFVSAAVDASASGSLVTLGIQPRWAETGYGYLEFSEKVRPGGMDALPVQSFREKPNAETAQRYVDEGRYFWNAGMFFWRTQVLLDAMRRYRPQISSVLDALPPFGNPSFPAALREIYGQADNISIDYAVMEPASKEAKVVALATDDFGWNDLGSWNAVYELDPSHALRTPVLQVNSNGCLVDVPGKVVALVGVSDLVVVETPDAILVTRRDEAQNVGQIVKMLEQQKRSDLL